MKLNRFIGIIGVMLVTACGQKNETKSEAEAKEEHEEGSGVSLTEEQIKMVKVQTGNIEMKNLSTSISVSGTLAVPNQNKAAVTSLAGGILRSLNIQPGDFVKKGQVIGTIANMEMSSMQQQLISINAQIKFTELELTRQRELVAGNAAPLKNLQRTEAEFNGLKAQQNALKRQLSALGISSGGAISSTLSITAPISGTISSINAEIGSQIDASSPIAQIINNSELHLDLYVYEKDLPSVSKGQTIHFTLTNNPVKEYDAVVYSIGTAFLNESKAVPLHATVVNDKSGLIEGMGVTARISIGEGLYPAVPDAAIVNNGGKDYIFIVSEGKKHEHHDGEEEEKGGHDEPAMNFERVQVVKGTSDLGYTEIKPVTELPTGTKIVTQGAFFLMAKMTNVGEHEH